MSASSDYLRKDKQVPVYQSLTRENTVGYESHDRAGRAENCRARNIFFPSRSTKRYNSKFFSLYQLQIVLLTIANKNKY